MSSDNLLITSLSVFSSSLLGYRYAGTVITVVAPECTDKWIKGLYCSKMCLTFRVSYSEKAVDLFGLLWDNNLNLEVLVVLYSKS